MIDPEDSVQLPKVQPDPAVSLVLRMFPNMGETLL
jgi:hypothetical protein